MQYCTKCKNICEDKLIKCPSCQRSKSLREAKETDLVFIERLGEVDAHEISVILEDNAVKYELHSIPVTLSTGLYDANESRTDKNLFVQYSDIETAKKVMNDYYYDSSAEVNEAPIDEKPSMKNILGSSAAVIAFMILAALTVFFSDAVANFLRSLF